MLPINEILDGDDVYYIPIPLTGKVVKAFGCVNEQALDAQTTLTLTDGTNTIGVITLPNTSAEGTVVEIVFDGTTKGKVELGPTKPLVATLAGGATGVEIALGMIIDIYHADN
ncbi:MAG TPA: hypothetical protein DDY86_09330 [Syntrophaceae bacterium]|nr:hypothetical protein [Syntrophaceae bacterium]